MVHITFLGCTMKLPFLNRKRYIEIKAYTNSKRAMLDVPLCLTKDIKCDHLNSDTIPRKDRKYTVSFNTCYGRVAALRNSITLRTWCEFDILTTKDTWEFKWPNNNEYMHVAEMNDVAFRPNGMWVIKVVAPWMMECNDKTLNVLHCSHIMNTSHLHIGSGVISMLNPSPNFFTYIPQREDTYNIPYKMPIIQMFPLTDLPIHIESSYDLNKYSELYTLTNSHPYFTGTVMKYQKNESTTI